MFKTRLKAISQNYINGLWEITFELLDGSPSIIERFKDMDLALEIKKWYKHRSLDANAYYWQMVQKLADAERHSKPYIHNEMLRKAGYTEVLDGLIPYVMLPDTDEARAMADEAETFHIRPTACTETRYENGQIVTYRRYDMLRGSHTYNTKEMSILIDLTIERCKGNDIETLPPDEIRRLVEKWQPKADYKA